MHLKLLNKLKPAVHKRVLPLVAGLVWVLVGLLLSGRAVFWLSAYQGAHWYLFVFLAMVLFVVKYRLVFRKLVVRNLDRISAIEGRPCVFSFVSWKSYLLIVVMIALGVWLRSTSVPREYLSVLYLGIGFAMVISGMQYFTLHVRSKE